MYYYNFYIFWKNTDISIKVHTNDTSYKQIHFEFIEDIVDHINMLEGDINIYRNRHGVFRGYQNKFLRKLKNRTVTKVLTHSLKAMLPLVKDFEVEHIYVPWSLTEKQRESHNLVKSISNFVFDEEAYNNALKFNFYSLILGSNKRLRKHPYKKTLHIAITTYERPLELLKLIRQILTYSDKYSLRLFIYDDASKADYSPVTNALRDSKRKFYYEYKKNAFNNGKFLHTKNYNNIFADIKNSNADYFIQCADDMTIVPDAYDIAIRAIEETNEDVIITTTCGFHYAKLRKNPKKFKEVKIGSYEYFTNTFVDGAYIAKKQFFEDIGYEIDIQDIERWGPERNLLRGSGSAGKIKEKRPKGCLILKSGTNIHKGNEDSVMNKELRKVETIFSVVNINPYKDKRVIVVGPSPTIEENGPEFGKFIDSFDVVVRTGNSYPVLQEKTQFIGTTTTVLYINQPFVSAPEFDFNKLDDGNLKYVYGPVERLQLKGITPQNVLILNSISDLDEDVKKVLETDEPINMFNGMRIIAEALRSGAKEVFVCGMDNYKNDNYYYDKYLPSTIKRIDVETRQRKFHPNVHSKQELYIQKLYKQNKIKLDKTTAKYFNCLSQTDTISGLWLTWINKFKNKNDEQRPN